jgi:phytanoyl-CoA hydroxylase
MLTAAQRRFFWTNGYLVLERFLNPQSLADLRAAVEDVVRRAHEDAAYAAAFLDIGPPAPGASPAIRRIFNPAEADPRFEQIALSDQVLDVVQDLIGPDLEFHHGKVNFKPPGSGAEVGWHQDFAFFPHTNTDLVACMFYLDDATRENGCLLVVPGSHRWGLLNHFDGERFIGAVTTDLHQWELQKVRAVEVPAGSMTVHHCLTLHASAENCSSRPRTVVIYEYRAADAMQLVPDQSRARHYGLLVRGQRTGQVRCEALSFRLPNHFVEGRQRSLYELQEEYKRMRGVDRLVATG